MPGPSLGGAAVGDDWLVRKVQDLERQLNELRAARSLESSSIGAGGLQVVNGGSIAVIDPATNRGVAFFGQTVIPDGSGRTQMVSLFTRDDQTAALQLADVGTAPGHTHQQALQWYARSGRIVIADDTTSGDSLARPHVEVGSLYNTDVSTYPATNATTFTTIAKRYFEVQNPRLTWQVELFAETGVTGQFKMLMNGIQVGTTQTVAALTFANWSTIEDRPVSVNVGDVVLVELQAKSSATTGKAKAQVLRFAGWES